MTDNKNFTYSIEDLKTLMARLRDPQLGCPWDIVQSYKTITPSTIEEAYEVVDAIEHGEMSDLREELGDLLFQVIFYSQLGDEDGHFCFDEIVHNLVAKLIRRHPHVFPDGTLQSKKNVSGEADSKTDEQVKLKWEAIKKQERAEKGKIGLLADVPVALPASTRAHKLQKRAASVAFDWRNAEEVIAKVEEELAELKIAIEDGSKAALEEEAGDLLFSMVNLTRHLKLDAESCLRRANIKFEKRFNYIEEKMNSDGRDMSAENQAFMESLWEEAKSKGL